MRHFCLIFLAFLASCETVQNNNSIGQLKGEKIDFADDKVEGGFEKAMQSYQKFLEQTPESAMTPDALRRLADLKIQKEYGALGSGAKNDKLAPLDNVKKIERPAAIDVQKITLAREAGIDAKQHLLTQEVKKNSKKSKKSEKENIKESGQAFEKRASLISPVKSGLTERAFDTPDGSGADLQSPGTLEAIILYKKLLAKYPNYDRNDQVLYQLSHAYEEIGQVEEAMKTMNTIVKDFPKSRYFDEVQFRRGEYYFTRKSFVDAKHAFKSIVDIGEGSSYYELSLYKLGWTYYKQEQYEDSLKRFIALLDSKIKTGYDFDHLKDTLDERRIEDTFRVVSLAFSNLGGAEAVSEYFNKFGKRSYELNIYNNLGDYYLDKRRYSDAAITYNTFVKSNPFHKVAPHFDIKVIDIYRNGNFPKLVIDAKTKFVAHYGHKSDYWNYFDIKSLPEVRAKVKSSLIELANHYHSRYQDEKWAKDKTENFNEAKKWYLEFLKTFHAEPETPAINYQLAELLLENKLYGQAAIEYEHTAYDYPLHGKSAEAGYAAVYAYRESASVVAPSEHEQVIQAVIRVSLKFADTFPKHQKGALVMEAAIDDIYGLKNYDLAVTTGHKLLSKFPGAEHKILRSAWLIIAHSSFELAKFKDAEEGYLNVLRLTPEHDNSRADVIENLSASIYKQGEQASKLTDYKSAAFHFLRIALSAPTSKIRPTADYDGATALIQLKDWQKAVSILSAFRSTHKGHLLQPEVTKKIAYVYKESGEFALAAIEYERIETESKNIEIRSEALKLAANLYIEANETDKAMQVYRRYVNYFPKPLEAALEIRRKMADILRTKNEIKAYFEELKLIVQADVSAGVERTGRTRYLGATSSLILTEPLFVQFAQIKLIKPFEQNLARKKNALRSAKEGFEKLLGYEVGEVASAATYYIAELYFNFNRALFESERPNDLSLLEKEQYELAIEEQAYPFEEKAIQIHEKNLELLSLGIYGVWIENSIEKLAKLIPARYAKYEESSGYISDVRREVSNADFDAAMSFIKAEKYEEGIQLLTKIINTSPNHAIAKINLALIYKKLGKLEQAEGSLKLALKAEPHNPVASNELALLYRKTGRFAEARQLYEKTLEKYPNFVMVHKNLGILCDLYLKDYKCALKNYVFYSNAVQDSSTVKIWITDLQNRAGK
jgi:tetratricopeptide (TPR) repeat protein